MVGKVMLCALMALSLTPPPIQARARLGIDSTANPEVVQVVCLGGYGTAFRVGPSLFLSVAHVTKVGGCAIGGKLITTHGTQGDFATVSNGTEGPWLQVDCAGFVKGREYIAIGHARGLRTQVEIEMVATGKTSGGFAELWSVFTVVPGQSGGPIIDAETRKVVGTINVFSPLEGLSGSVELKGTSVCR